MHIILITIKVLDDINFKSLLKQIQSKLINKLKRKFLSCLVLKKIPRAKELKSNITSKFSFSFFPGYQTKNIAALFFLLQV